MYGFDLILIELLPLRDLVRKAYDMRAKYRSIAGQKDYDAYIASRPPDLTLSVDLDESEAQGEVPLPLTSPPFTSPPFTSPPITSPEFTPPPITSPPALPVTQATTLSFESLRADIRYLLGQFYLYYALLPYREGFRDEITRRARNLTYIFLGVFAVMLFLASIERLLVVDKESLRVPTILVVVVTGILGGCVSMLQRIQSAPAEGDAIFNLSSLVNGWKGMSLSPLYGAIFAVLFYMLFAAGVVEGVVFPKVQTPENFVAATTPTPTPTPTDATQGTASADAAAPASTPAPQPNVKRPSSIFWLFTDGTFPISGKAYALLIIWSFLAGFLERLVPDALNRLAAKTQSIGGATT